MNTEHDLLREKDYHVIAARFLVTFILNSNSIRNGFEKTNIG